MKLFAKFKKNKEKNKEKTKEEKNQNSNKNNTTSQIKQDEKTQRSKKHQQPVSVEKVTNPRVKHSRTTHI